MTRSLSMTLALTLAMGVLAPPVFAGPPNADEIMQKVEDRSQGKDETATHSLAIVPKQGSKRFRRYILMRKEYPNVIKLVTFFQAPTDVINAAFLVWDNKNTDDQRWIYLPAIGQVRRLVVGDSRQSFFGSDFVYEDFTNRDPDLDTHKLVGAQKVDNWDCWVIDSVPKNPRGVEFARMRSWIWKQGYMVIRQEEYDSSGNLLRRLQAKAIDTVQGIPSYRQIIATNIKSGSESKLEISNLHYNTGLADERFAETQLQRGAPK
jgi:outer membrane lipoprotein-sorting protein